MESSLQGRLETSKMIWRDEEAVERQDPSRRDEESSLQGRLEESKESWRDEDAAETQRGSFKECWGDEEGAESS